MLSAELLEFLPEPVVELFKKLESDAIQTICRRIGKIGALEASDAAKLSELRRIGFDLDAIRRETAETLEKSEAEVRKIFAEAAEAEYNGYKVNFDISGAKFVPFAENRELNGLLEAISRSTAAEFRDLTETTGFYNTALWSKDGARILVDGFKPLPEFYRDSVDYAVARIRVGQDDFYGAMRRSVREMADRGFLTVMYRNSDDGKKPYARRLDSSVRAAVSGGLQRLSRETAAALGEAFGADGMEISWHSGARPSHMDFAGRQYGMAEYERVCLPLLMDYNCYHRAFPIILGVSVPNYTREQLAEMNADELVKREFEGKSYTKYEALQVRRRLETETRREKDRAVAFKAVGDRQAEIAAKAKVTALNQKYVGFSEAVGIPTERERAAVAGYTRGQSLKTIAKSREEAYNKAVAQMRAGIKNGVQKLAVIPEKQAPHIPGASYVSGKSYIYGGMKEAQALVDKYAGTGEFEESKSGVMQKREIIKSDRIIGVAVNSKGEKTETSVFKIHYRKTGTHIVPKKEDDNDAS